MSRIDDLRDILEAGLFQDDMADEIFAALKQRDELLDRWADTSLDRTENLISIANKSQKFAAEWRELRDK